MEEKRKCLDERLPKHIIWRIERDICRASRCWELPYKAGIFDYAQAGNIAFDLCHHIADYVEEITSNRFIGMKDKTGIEIYEGDVCKYSEGKQTPIIASIEYEKCCFVFDKVPLHSWLDEDGKCVLEVVGNIYENPELLEDQK